MEIITNILKGMVIGISNIIPGVSGGTMAVVMGIYDKIISSVTHFFKDWKKNIVFLGTIGVGAGIGILAFSNLLSVMLTNFPLQTNYFFIGLIIGTLPLLIGKATEKKVNKINFIPLIIAFLIVVPMGIISEPETGSTIIRDVNMQSILMLFFAGFIAAATMILPGVSGSFVLLLLGLYQTMITAVKEFNIPLLCVVAVGVLLGFLLMTKIIDKLFNINPQLSYFIILGLVGGSAIALILQQGFAFNLAGITSIITFVVGFGIAYLIGKKE